MERPEDYFFTIRKELVVETAKRLFEKQHSANFEEIQTARAIVEGNQQIISHFLENGSLTKKQLDGMWENPDLQDAYAIMADAERLGKTEVFDEGFKQISKRPDTFCGWLAFYNEYLETALKMPLVPKTRLDNQVERYFEEE